MTLPQHHKRHLSFAADLRVDLDRGHAIVTAKQSDVIVEVPDVATGLRLCRSVLPRGLRRRMLRVLTGLELRLAVKVRQRVVLHVGRSQRGLLSLFGIPHVRLHPINLGLASLGI